MVAKSPGDGFNASLGRVPATPSQLPAELFIKLAQLLPLPIYILDAELNVVYCNDECRRFGTDTDDVGVNLSDFSPGIEATLSPMIHQCLASGEQQHSEGWINSLVRGECFLLVDCIPLTENLAGCIIIDRTVKEHAEAALEQADEAVYESEWRFQTLIQAMAECVLLTDGEGKIKFANRAAERLAGCAAEGLKDRTVAEFLAPEQQELLERQRNQRKQGKSSSYELQIIAPRIGPRTMMVWSSPRYDTQGEFCGSFVVAQDITESMRSQLVQSVLLNISAATSLSGSLPELVGKIHSELRKLISISNFYVALYDRQQQQYFFPFHVDERDEDFRTQEMPRSLTDYVRRTGEPLLADERLQQKLVELGEIDILGPTCSIWLGVPLKTTRGILGVVVVQDYHEAEAYDEADLQLLDGLDGSLKDRVESLEARILKECLIRNRWNKSQAAKELGLSRVGLRSKLERYGLEKIEQLREDEDMVG